MISDRVKERLVIAPTLLLVAVLVCGTRACQRNYFFAAQASASPSATASPTEDDDDDDITQVPTTTATATPTETPTATASIAAFFRSRSVIEGLSEIQGSSSNARAKLKTSKVQNTTSPRTDAGNWLGNAYSDEEVQGASLDSDGDGYTDALEDDFNTDSFDAESVPPPPVTYLSDRLAGIDDDADGLSTAQEDQLGTSPSLSDTDNDGVSDGAEVLSKSDPLDPKSKPKDRDGDGLSASFEAQIGTNPSVPDTDADGVDDDLEVALKLNPLSNDSDKDGILDGKELALGSDPLVPEGG